MPSRQHLPSRHRPPPPSLDPTRLLAAYTTTTVAVRARVEMSVRGAWSGLDAWRTPDISRFARQVAPVVTGGQRQIAALTDGYLAAMTAAKLGRPYRPTGIPKSTIGAIRGDVTPIDVYERTGPTVWTALSRGYTIDEAAGQGLGRALIAVATDLQLAKTFATRYALERNDNVVGYRRVPDGAACDLCLLASTQRYHVEDLMPIHDRCACDVEPLFGEHDPGQVIDRDLLDRLNAAQDSGTDVAVHDHGELGPVLTVAGQNFDGPDDI